MISFNSDSCFKTGEKGDELIVQILSSNKKDSIYQKYKDDGGLFCYNRKKK